MDLTHWYRRASRARLNCDKTQAKFRNTLLVGGGRSNWPDVIGKARKRLGYWRLRGLTMEGNVLIIKALILPLFLLISSVFIPPRRVLLDLHWDIFYLLWRSKWERVTRKVMKMPKTKRKDVPNFHLFLPRKYTTLYQTYATVPSRDHKTSAMAQFWMGCHPRTQVFTDRSQSTQLPV